MRDAGSQASNSTFVNKDCHRLRPPTHTQQGKSFWLDNAPPGCTSARVTVGARAPSFEHSTHMDFCWVGVGATSNMLYIHKYMHTNTTSVTPPSNTTSGRNSMEKPTVIVLVGGPVSPYGVKNYLSF